MEIINITTHNLQLMGRLEKKNSFLLKRSSYCSNVKEIYTLYVSQYILGKEQLLGKVTFKTLQVYYTLHLAILRNIFRDVLMTRGVYLTSVLKLFPKLINDFTHIDV